MTCYPESGTFEKNIFEEESLRLEFALEDLQMLKLLIKCNYSGNAALYKKRYIAGLQRLQKTLNDFLEKNKDLL